MGKDSIKDNSSFFVVIPSVLAQSLDLRSGELVRARARDGHGFDPIPDEHPARIKAGMRDV